MIKRVFWLGVGVAVGAVVTYKVTETMRKATPSYVAHSAGEKISSARHVLSDFFSQISEGMNERETELRAKHGLPAEAI